MITAADHSPPAIAAASFPCANLGTVCSLRTLGTGRSENCAKISPRAGFGYLLGLVLLLLTASCQPPKQPEKVREIFGGVVELKEDGKNYRLTDYVEVLSDPDGQLTIADVTASTFEAYRAYPEKIATHRWYWGKVQVVNRLPTAAQNVEWVLYFPVDWTTLDIYTQGPDGEWLIAGAGTFLAFEKKQFAPTAWGNLLKLHLPSGEIRTVYFRGKSERKADPPSFNIYLQPTDSFYYRMGRVKVGNAIFIGFMGMMLLYNLIVYFFGRDRSFIYYSGYLFMMILYATYSNDDLADWFGRHVFVEYPHYFAFFKLSIFVGLTCYLAFIRNFVNIKQLLPGWDLYFRALTYLGFPLLCLHVFVSFDSNFSHVLEDRVSIPYIGLVIGSCIALLYPLYRTGDARARFVFAGIAAISIGALLTMLSRVAFPPFSIFYLQTGVVAEVLIFSLGLAYWQKKQVLARERADFALRESRLIQEKQEIEAERLRDDHRKNLLLEERNQEIEVLLREIHHRVKNNLEVVSSLLELQSVTLTDGDARDAMLAGRSRVTTMGILHQKLYQGDHLGTVGMREYFSDLTQNLGHTFGVNGLVTFTIDVPEDLRLDVDTAVPLGLIANELITNSIKYAFVGADAGAVVVEMRRVEGRYLLAVSDDGSGKVEGFSGGTGFGTRLVGMLVQQLEGEVREVNEEGVRTEVRFVAENSADN